jgi:hypothetical protein
MGYTHYWDYHPELIKDEKELKEKFRNAVRQIKQCYFYLKKNQYAQPCIIRGGLGKGLPKFLQNQIWFNGDGSTDLDHETFYLTWNNMDSEGRDNWGFCKTARKPYDLLVCMSLLALENAFQDPKVFSYSSDGDDSEWQGAKDLYKEIMG